MKRSQPPLPSLEAFQVLETLARIAGAAEIKLLDVLIVAQLVGASSSSAWSPKWTGMRIAMR
jgi:hypothetical protein